MKTYLLIFYLFIQSLHCFSQIDTTDHSPASDSIWQQYHLTKKASVIIGYQLQQNQFVELGLAIKNHGINGPHIFTNVYGISSEFKINTNDDFIWGLKTGLWFGGGYNFGLNLINYTDFEHNTLRLRPEVGTGWNSFRLVYGYNAALTNKEFIGINKHNFSLQFIIGFKKMKTHIN